MKYALIGGSKSGLATATISELIKRDYYVFALDINNEEKEENSICYLKVDLTDKSQITRAKEIIEKKTDKIDFLSSFAGCVILGFLFENAENKIEKMFNLTLFTTFNLNSTFIPFVTRAKGIIAIISSEYGKITAIPLHGYYPMAKHALEIYADSLRREIQKSGTKVITIRPGAFKTAMQQAVNSQFDSLLEETELYKAPLLKMKNLMTGELKRAQNPEILGKKLVNIIEKKHPKAHYNICNSFKMKLLTLLPSSMQDWIFSLFF